MLRLSRCQGGAYLIARQRDLLPMPLSIEPLLSRRSMLNSTHLRQGRVPERVQGSAKDRQVSSAQLLPCSLACKAS